MLGSRSAQAALLRHALQAAGGHRLLLSGCPAAVATSSQTDGQHSTSLLVTSNNLSGCVTAARGSRQLSSDLPISQGVSSPSMMLPRLACVSIVNGGISMPVLPAAWQQYMQSNSTSSNNRDVSLVQQQQHIRSISTSNSSSASICMQALPAFWQPCMRSNSSSSNSSDASLQQQQYMRSRSNSSSSSMCLPTLPAPWQQLMRSSSTSSNSSRTSDSPLQQQQKPDPRAEHLWNLPNALSIARGASGPPIAYLIIQEQWPWALAAVSISGATDWLDGYLARRMRLQSILGSYLDPLGDKLLICSVALALAYKGLVPGWVAAVVVGRDVVLVVGLLVHRWRELGWRIVPMEEFVRLAPMEGGHRSSTSSSDPEEAVSRSPSAKAAAASSEPPGGFGAKGVEAGSGGVPAAGVPLMKPLLISKANTVMQLALLAGCMGKAWVEWPDAQVLHVLELSTAATTVASCAAYAHKYLPARRRA